MQRQARSPIRPLWACPWAKNFYLWNCLMDFLRSKFYWIALTCSCAASGSFAHSPPMGMPMGEKLLSQEPLHGFSPFEILSHCLTSSCATFGSFRPLWACPWAKNFYLWNCLMDFLCSKFCWIALTCSCAASGWFAHLPPLGMPMGEKLCLWNQCMDFLHSKFCWIDLTCSFAERISLKRLDGFSLF